MVYDDRPNNFLNMYAIHVHAHKLLRAPFEYEMSASESSTGPGKVKRGTGSTISGMITGCALEKMTPVSTI